MSYSKAMLGYFGEDEDVAQYAAGLVADASIQLEDLAEMLAELGDWNVCSEAALIRTKEIRELSDARSKDAASGQECHPLTDKPEKSLRKSRRPRKGRKAKQKGGVDTRRRPNRSDRAAVEQAGEEAGRGSGSAATTTEQSGLSAPASAPATTAATAAQVARAREAAAAVSQAAAASQAEAGPVRRARAALGALSSHEAPVRDTGATIDSATASLARIHESRCSSGQSASREAVAAANRLVEMVGAGAGSSGADTGSAAGLGLAIWALQRAGGSPDEAAMLMLGASSGVTSAAGSAGSAAAGQSSVPSPKSSGASGGMDMGGAGGPGLGEVASLPDWVPPSGEDGVTSAAGPGGGEPLEQYRGWLWRRWHARRRELLCSLEEARKEERAHERVLARFGSSRPLAAGVDVAGEEAEQAKQAAKRARRKGKGKEKAPTQLWLDSRGRMVRSAIGHAKAQAKQVRKQMRRLDAQHGGGMRFLDGKVVSREGDKFV